MPPIFMVIDKKWWFLTIPKIFIDGLSLLRRPATNTTPRNAATPHDTLTPLRCNRWAPRDFEAHESPPRSGGFIA